jgi:hypothetical protein
MCYRRKYATFLLIINNFNLRYVEILNLPTNSIALSIRLLNNIYKSDNMLFYGSSFTIPSTHAE